MLIKLVNKECKYKLRTTLYKIALKQKRKSQLWISKTIIKETLFFVLWRLLYHILSSSKPLITQHLVLRTSRVGR